MKILIIVDMQNDFISGSLGSKQAQEIIPNIVDKINKKEYNRIFLTQDYHEKEKYLSSQEGKKLPIIHCEPNTHGYQINKDIFNAVKESNIEYDIIQKSTFGTFKFNFFKKNDIIEIFGVATDICVITNALILKTQYPENQIIVDSKCCAGITPESHEAALQVMKMCQIEVI